jgi:hypothetical protein
MAKHSGMITTLAVWALPDDLLILVPAWCQRRGCEGITGDPRGKSISNLLIHKVP